MSAFILAWVMVPVTWKLGGKSFSLMGGKVDLTWMPRRAKKRAGKASHTSVLRFLFQRM
jgi:hypothetical protein